MGRGDGTFGPPRRVTSDPIDGVPSVADLNGDGTPDLAFSTGSAIKVAPGRGDGTFGPAATIASARPSARRRRPISTATAGPT